MHYTSLSIWCLNPTPPSFSCFTVSLFVLHGYSSLLHSSWFYSLAILVHQLQIERQINHTHSMLCLHFCCLLSQLVLLDFHMENSDCSLLFYLRTQLQLYIVYMGGQPKDVSSVQSLHISLLEQVIGRLTIYAI